MATRILSVLSGSVEGLVVEAVVEEGGEEEEELLPVAVELLLLEALPVALLVALGILTEV